MRIGLLRLLEEVWEPVGIQSPLPLVPAACHFMEATVCEMWKVAWELGLLGRRCLFNAIQFRGLFNDGVALESFMSVSN